MYVFDTVLFLFIWSIHVIVFPYSVLMSSHSVCIYFYKVLCKIIKKSSIIQVYYCYYPFTALYINNVHLCGECFLLLYFFCTVLNFILSLHNFSIWVSTMGQHMSNNIILSRPLCSIHLTKFGYDVLQLKLLWNGKWRWRNTDEKQHLVWFLTVMAKYCKFSVRWTDVAGCVKVKCQTTL